MSAPEGVAARLAVVELRISEACQRAGRDRSTVTLVAVTKTQPLEAVANAAAAGIRDFGENRVQEGVAKVASLAGRGLIWHLIGRLQSNKAKAAVASFDFLHGIDNARALTAVAASAETHGRRPAVFLEVNIAGEASKGGCAVDDLDDLLATARRLPSLALVGLMTVAPAVSDPETVRPIFQRLSGLARAHGLESLSMGMTGDFDVAIEEGATHIRVGRAIFGERKQ